MHLKMAVKTYAASVGCQVRTGILQSIPSSSMDSCAGLSETAPLSAWGQMKRPFSSRLANRHIPWPSHHSSLMMSPRLPRKTKTWPENGSWVSAFCTKAPNHQSRGVCRSDPPPTTRVFPSARQSCRFSQSLQYTAHAGLVNHAAQSHTGTTQFNFDHASRGGACGVDYNPQG